MPYSSLIVILTKWDVEDVKLSHQTKTKKKKRKIENNGNTDIQSTLILCGNEESVKKVHEQKQNIRDWAIKCPEQKQCMRIPISYWSR